MCIFGNEMIFKKLLIHFLLLAFLFQTGIVQTAVDFAQVAFHSIVSAFSFCDDSEDNYCLDDSSFQQAILVKTESKEANHSVNNDIHHLPFLSKFARYNFNLMLENSFFSYFFKTYNIPLGFYHLVIQPPD